MGDVFSGRWLGATPWRAVSLGLLALVGLVLLSPASASATTASVTLPAGTSPAGADALEVSSYQDDFGVSKQTAEERLEVQDDGAGIVEQLEGAQGNRYAGVWFDNDSGEFVVPVPVPVVAGAGGPSVATALAGSGLEGDFRTKPVQSSWDELEAAQKRIDNALLPLIEEGLVGTSLDPRVNAVVIEQAAGANRSQRAEVRAAAQGKAVEVEVRESQDRKLGISPEACQFPAAVCDAPMRGGVNIVPNGGFRGTGCTAAFKATGKTFGNRFMLTAGHCVAESGASKWDSFSLAPETRRNLGYVDAYSFPNHDYAAIRANGTYWDKPSWPTRVTYWGVNQEYPINYESSSYVGEFVCHAGQQTGLSCGAVTGTNLTEPVGEGNYVSNLTRFEHICTIAGDSGGPVFAGNTALGIYSSSDKPKGAENPCYYNGYYTEITEDTDALGVSVAPRIVPPKWTFDNLGGQITSDPDISTAGYGHLSVFARGTNNHLWHKGYGGNWGSWEDLGGTLTSGPGAVSWSSDRIDVVGRTTNNSVSHWAWGPGGWVIDNLGGQITSDPDISSWGYGRLDVFAKGTGNELLHKVYDGTWHAWENLGGTLASGPSAVSWGVNRIDVVARAIDNTVLHWAWTGSAWVQDNLGGEIVSDPDIASSGYGNLNIFAQGPGEDLVRLGYNGAWNWEWLGGIGSHLTSGPGAVSWNSHRIDVVGRVSDGSVGHWAWDG